MPHARTVVPKRFAGLIVTIAALTPSTSWSCKPIVPLVHLLSGATAAGPVFLTQSLWWLLAAASIKCLAFVWFEKRLPWTESVRFMLLALLSGSGTGAGILVALPLVFILGIACEGGFGIPL